MNERAHPGGPSEPEVLIVGAGPTGLVLALWLTLQGVRVRIVDLTAGPGTTSRALAVQARTMELYRQAGLTEEVIARGHRTPAANFWVRGRRVARAVLEVIGGTLSPYAFMLIFPQDEHERLLIERLEARGVTVERQTEVVAVRDLGEAVEATLKRADGGEEMLRAAYVAGCDGVHSVVRHGLGEDFEGGTYRQLFYVADTVLKGPAVDGELHIDLDDADFLAVFPMAGEGRARLVGTVRDERADRPETLRFEDVSDRAIGAMNLTVERVNWFSTYRVHHRLARRFAEGRAFLLGDAAHVHSPAGGQGMNTGIGDAINLAWKLAAVLRGQAPASLLATYEPERAAFARRLVATTDRAFTLATADGAMARWVRTRIAPVVVPLLFSLPAARRFMFRTVGQLGLNYRGGALSAGRAGQVRGGDRLPWAGTGGADNFAPLRDPRWQLHIYGTANDGLAAWCGRRRVPLHVFAFEARHAAAGLARDGAYLLRPDSYVALASATADPAIFDRYFAERGLTP